MGFMSHVCVRVGARTLYFFLECWVFSVLSFSRSRPRRGSGIFFLVDCAETDGCDRCYWRPPTTFEMDLYEGKLSRRDDWEI